MSGFRRIGSGGKQQPSPDLRYQQQQTRHRQQQERGLDSELFRQESGDERSREHADTVDALMQAHGGGLSWSDTSLMLRPMSVG